MSTKFKTQSAIDLPPVIRELGPNAVGVEIGVWMGTNIGYLLQECDNIKMLYGVDPYEPYQDWNRYIDENLMKEARESAENIINAFPGRGQLIVGTSEDARNQCMNLIDFVFIDGDHSFERCYEDLNLWYDAVRPSGLFSGHDFTLPGVNKAIHKFRKENKINGFFKVVRNDTWYWIKD